MPKRAYFRNYQTHKRVRESNYEIIKNQIWNIFNDLSLLKNLEIDKIIYFTVKRKNIHL